jgi:protein involved in polysaccharide export with SLBB domain
MPESPASTEPTIVDIDQLEPVRPPVAPPVDVDVVRPPSSGADDQTDSFIYIPERGEWVRVPRATGNGTTAAQPPAPATGAPTDPAAAAPAQSLTRILAIDYGRLRRGDASQNIVLRPGDFIYVDGPPQGFFYIDGEVNRVGVYSMPAAGTMTLSRAITSAGGLGPIAIPQRVDLTRKVGHFREATIRLDLAAIRQRTEPDVVVKPDDHIIVGTSFWATPMAIIRNGFRATYGFGFLLDRNFGNDVFGPPPGEGNSIF